MPSTSRLITARDFRQSVYSSAIDNAEGVNLDSTIVRAEAIIESKARRRFKKETYIEIVRPTSTKIFLRYRPVITVTKIESRFDAYDAWLEYPFIQYTLDQGAGILTPYPGRMGFTGYDARITYEAGYEIIPADIKQAIIMQTALLLYNDPALIQPGDGKEPSIRYLKKDIEEIICNYRAVGIVA